MHPDVAIIIPARIGSTRLPRKLLEKIGEKPVISHVVTGVKRAASEVIVATDDDEIAAVAESSGAKAIMTNSDCPSGSDRVFAAYMQLENMSDINYIINVQGDMPFVDGNFISNLIDKMKASDYDIITPYVKINEDYAKDPSNVKIVRNNSDRAMYFSRCPIPYDGKEFLYHVGIYGFEAKALEKFVSLQPSAYEICEKLEQLRALENGMSIGLIESSEIPISIDTKDDLERAREHFARSGS